ncbi:RDD family protein [Dyella kyungheensis]|uniref:RDD family protein n=1 Tax=Dyella kyungheensis TaxID=1242174 RepID=UPI003CF35BA2
MLDTFREVVTPEGVVLQLRAAGPVPRALAWLIDVAIRMGVLVAAGSVFAVLGRAGAGFYLIALFLVWWFYPIVFEVLWKGCTPGKRALNLRVISGNGGPLGWQAAFTRDLLRVVDMLPLFYATGLVSCLLDPWGRRLGDMVANTLVVHDAPPRALVEATAAPPIASTVVLRQHEQAALIAFAERGPRQSLARQIELANLAEPLTGLRGEAGVHQLYGLANGLLGRNE